MSKLQAFLEEQSLVKLVPTSGIILMTKDWVMGRRRFSEEHAAMPMVKKNPKKTHMYVVYHVISRLCSYVEKRHEDE